MAGSIFLFIDGIPGESTSRIFEDWIDVISFSFGITMEIDQESRIGSGGGTSGSADAEDFSFDTKMGVSSMVLFQACAMGAVIPRIKLVQCNVVNEKLYTISEYGLGDSIVSNVSIDASGGDIASQSFTVNYGSVVCTYHCYNHYDPSAIVATVERGWSVLSANPQKADKNAYRASSIANDKEFTIPKGSKSRASKHYENYKEGVKVDFAHGPIVDMNDETYQKQFDEVKVTSKNQGSQKMFT